MKTMPTIEITLDRGTRQWLVLLAAMSSVIGMLALGALGRLVTPLPGRLLTWSDWQAFKLERQYQIELASLRNSAEQLAAALDVAPDPIRVGLLHDRLAQRHHTGVTALANQRTALLAANEAVYAWALASLTRERTLELVQIALDGLALPNAPSESAPRMETQ